MRPLLLTILISQALASVRLETKTRLNSRLANIHVTLEGPVERPIRYTYGGCSDIVSESARHVIGQTTSEANNSRLVWVLPENLLEKGCISAWDSKDDLVGRSQELQPAIKKRNLTAKRKRELERISMDDSNGIDAWGPWFDGVKLLESKNLTVIDVQEAKSKEIAIIGAGMAGLMTYLILHQSGLDNVKILEASNRLGGRVHTEYLSGGPFNYSYQEMGPMRFPTTRTFRNETYNISDHQIVSQLAEEMNRLNGHDRNLSVDFIPWIQNNENAYYYYDGIKLDTGLPPTIRQVAENKSLSITLPLEESTVKTQDKMSAIFANETMMRDMAVNMHKAHKDFIVNGLGGIGGDVWSEFAYFINYVGASLNDTNFVTAGYGAASFWNGMYESLQFGATTWRTIDGGLNRLPLSFHPLVDNVTSLNVAVERIQFDEEAQKVTVQWKSSDKGWASRGPVQEAVFDYAIVAIPPPQLKKLRLPRLSSTIRNAIDTMAFAPVCKVALEYTHRFWEQLERPIVGGQSVTDIPGIGTIAYPSYCLGCEGPASILASYSMDAWGDIWTAIPEEEHVSYVVDAMEEIHGPIAREAWTGKYARRCWRLDRFEGGGWTEPMVGEHQLYLPEFFKTHKNMIFVGEHTTYTHAWVASALESGIRGAVQMLLELGLVDEAKDAVDKWMGRWLELVSRFFMHVPCYLVPASVLINLGATT
ncbi:L-amino acid oxidase [Poronia punctata]|nr:L-amino acid oxidase [Poronia punctata]